MGGPLIERSSSAFASRQNKSLIPNTNICYDRGPICVISRGAEFFTANNIVPGLIIIYCKKISLERLSLGAIIGVILIWSIIALRDLEIVLEITKNLDIVILCNFFIEIVYVDFRF